MTGAGAAHAADAAPLDPLERLEAMARYTRALHDWHAGAHPPGAERPPYPRAPGWIYEEPQLPAGMGSYLDGVVVHVTRELRSLRATNERLTQRIGELERRLAELERGAR